MNDKKIKHLVFSSGGPCGALLYGAAKYLEKQHVWKHADLETIYGCSVGTVIAIVIALKYEWETADDYFIKRPWDKIFFNLMSDSHINQVSKIMNIFNHKGFATYEQFCEVLRPLLMAKDLTLTTTLAEFYAATNIEVHFFTTEINRFKYVDLSHKTHPHLLLAEAAYMSCSIPYVFQPIIRDGACYLDGAVISGYPVNECLRGTKCALDEVLGFAILWERDNCFVDKNTSIFSYFSTLTTQLSYHIMESVNELNVKIPNQVICSPDYCKTPDEWMKFLKEEDVRRKIFKKGETYGLIFHNYKLCNKMTTAVCAELRENPYLHIENDDNDEDTVVKVDKIVKVDDEKDNDNEEINESGIEHVTTNDEPHVIAPLDLVPIDERIQTTTPLE